MRAFPAFIVPALIAAAAASPAQSQTVYSQAPADPPGFGYYSSSQPVPQRNFKHADDFTLAAAATIHSVRFWGMSEGRVSTGISNFSAFTVEFFATNPTTQLPAALLHTETFAAALTAPTTTGRVAFDTGATEYGHTISLASPISLLAGTKYHIAISATPVVPTGDVWLWQDGRFVNGTSGIYRWSTGAWSTFQDTDSAFELVTIPAPGTALLAASLTAGAAARRRRRA